ncbi:MAG TPA: AI-2E family transporter, partial [Acidimicrobiales bacterium]
MTERLRRAGQTSWALVGIAALLAVLGLLAWFVRVVFPPLILAGAIVFILNPVVTRLQRHGVPRALGATFAYVALLGVFVGAGFLLVPLATSQGEQLAEEWPAIEHRVERWVDDRAVESQGTFWEFTRQELTEAFSQDDASLRERLTRLREISVEVFHVLLVLFLAPVIAFYLLVDLPHVRRAAEDLVPEAAREEVMHVAGRLNRAIGGFFRGQLLVAAIVGIMCSIGLLVIGLRFWFLVGIIAGLFNVIPLIGPWVGGIPGVVIALTTGSPLQALGVVVVMVGAQ